MFSLYLHEVQFLQNFRKSWPILTVPPLSYIRPGKRLWVPHCVACQSMDVHWMSWLGLLIWRKSEWKLENRYLHLNCSSLDAQNELFFNYPKIKVRSELTDSISWGSQAKLSLLIKPFSHSPREKKSYIGVSLIMIESCWGWSERKERCIDVMPLGVTYVSLRGWIRGLVNNLVFQILYPTF